jgi:uncharacterized membrane protein
METFRSDLSNKDFPISDKILGRSVNQSILSLVKKDHPQFTRDKYLSLSELNDYRKKYIESFFSKKMGTLTALEKKVLESLENKTTLTDKLDSDEKQTFTFGQKVADHVASFGGSWTFIISFGIFLFLWILLNIYWLANKGFDPYPFILLNLILSTLAAIQAPVIMMSQNRQEEKDRDRSKKDYMVNLKAELEIKMLHEKIDHLITSEQQEALETHKIQMEMLDDILKRVTKMTEKEAE